MPRPKGSKNKAPRPFRDKLRLYCESIGVDPFEFLARALKNPNVKFEYKIQCAKELAKYLESQLRSVEVELGTETRRAILFRYGKSSNGHAVRLVPEGDDAARN